MSDLDDYQTPEGYGSTVGKCLTYEEIEALLTAERERCAKVAEDPKTWWGWSVGREVGDSVAAAIRSLAPQTIGGE